MPKQIPVYLFVGQLESGKTKFIQETMEDPNFDSGDKTLLLVCEEGEIEYDPKKFAFGGVHVAQIEDKSELTQENLTALEKKSGCGRVIIEYNGMWLVQELYDAMPDNWLSTSAWRLQTARPSRPTRVTAPCAACCWIRFAAASCWSSTVPRLSTMMRAAS